jgi:single-strand DNA-binding protein
MNIAIVDGRFVRDPELKTGASGKEFCKFTIASDRKKDKDGNKVSDFIDCTAFGQTGAFIAKYYHKGDGIQLVGRFESDKYTDKNGQNRTNWGLSVEQAFFPLGKGKADSGSTVPSEAAPADVELPF